MSRRRKQPRRRYDGRVPGRAIRQATARLEHGVRRHGWVIQYVGGPTCAMSSCGCSTGKDGPPFAYTVGLFGLGHPELLVFSLPQQVAAGLLNAIGEGVRGGDRLQAGHTIDIDGWGHRIVCEDVPNPGEIVFSANDFYRRRHQDSVPVLQLTYDDDNGTFPWEEGYAGDEQPRPGTFRA